MAGSSNEPDIRRLREKIAPYCEARPEITACYLFGSYASGKNRPGSDLDLAFLVRPDLNTRQIDQFRSAVIIELGRLTRLDIHPLIMNTPGLIWPRYMRYPLRELQTLRSSSG